MGSDNCSLLRKILDLLRKYTQPKNTTKSGRSAHFSTGLRSFMFLPLQNFEPLVKILNFSREELRLPKNMLRVQLFKTEDYSTKFVSVPTLFLSMLMILGKFSVKEICEKGDENNHVISCKYKVSILYLFLLYVKFADS